MCSCNIGNDNADENGVLEIALDANNNDVDIENNATLDQNFINNNTADDDLSKECQNEIVNDAIQNVASDEFANGACADATDDGDWSPEHGVTLAHEMNDGEHKELIKGLLEKIIGNHLTSHATDKKTS